MGKNGATKSKRLMVILILSLIGWMLFVQSCMRFSMSDATAVKEFSRAGLLLKPHTLQYRQHHLHYVVTGDENKPTLVFIHGSPGSWTAFKDYLKDKDLLQQYRLVSVDRPGFGNSDFWNAEHLQLQAQIISCLFDSLNNGKKFYFIGHSLGGPLVIALAAIKPASTGAIVIVAGSINAAEEKPEKWRKPLLYAPLKYILPGALRPANAELWYLKNDLKLLLADFKKITCPVYFMHGSKDGLVPYRNMQWGMTMFVNAPLVKQTTLENADHFIPWTNYNDLKSLLLQLNK